jgi:PAS domain S-box-containing protein
MKSRSEGTTMARRTPEAALSGSEKMYRTIFEVSGTGMAIVETDTTVSLINSEMERISGYSKQEVEGKMSWRQVVLPEYLPFIENIYRQRRRDPESAPNSFGFRIRNKQGQVRDLHGRADFLPMRDKTIVSLIDLTDYLQVEKSLQISEADYRAIFNAAHDGIFILDPKNGAILDVNQKMMEMYGYSRAEALLLQADDLSINQPPFTRKGAMERIKEAVLGIPQLIEWHCRHKSGKLFWGEVNLKSALIGGHERILAIVRDISERKRIEEDKDRYQDQLRSLALELSLLEERERHRLATAIHDHIGQNLALAKIKLDNLRSQAGNTSLVQSMEEVREFLEQAITYTRSLSFELSPPVLYELGFSAAVEWLADYFRKRHGIQITIEDDQRAKPISDSVRVFLFQAVRELLTNVVKHARAHQIRIVITRQNQIIKLLVDDDGQGLTTSTPLENENPSEGFGLFSIRERLKYIGGDFKIKSLSQKGTRVFIQAPLLNQGQP